MDSPCTMSCAPSRTVSKMTGTAVFSLKLRQKANKNTPETEVEDKDGQWHNKNHTPKERGICMDKILVVEDNMELSETLCRNPLYPLPIMI